MAKLLGVWGELKGSGCSLIMDNYEFSLTIVADTPKFKKIPKHFKEAFPICSETIMIV